MFVSFDSLYFFFKISPLFIEMNSLNVVDFNIDIDSLQTDFETSCGNSYDFH